MSEKVYIVAELSANHIKDLEIAIRTFQAAANSGADAIKVQTFKPESLTLPADIEGFGPRNYGTWKGFSSWDLYSKACMPYEWHTILKEEANKLGIDFFSTVFDLEGVDFLEEVNVSQYKISSFEITDLPLIEKVARTGKPIIVSTGLATIEDIENCVNSIRKIGNNPITLLKCTSEYPTSPENLNLLGIPFLKNRFNVNVGLSDHSQSTIIPAIAVGLGARMIERHIILDSNIDSVDKSFSTTPDAFKQMVENVRIAERSLGNSNFILSESDRKRRKHIFAIKDIQIGEQFSHENTRSLRASGLLAPSYYNQIIGKKAKNKLEKGSAIDFEDF